MRELQRKLRVNIGLGVCFAMFWPIDIVFAQDTLKTKKTDSSKYRIVNPYLPNFRVRDRHGDPYSNYTTQSPLFLKDPKNLNTEISLDTGMHYNISEKMGKMNFRPNSAMPFLDFSKQQDRTFQKNYYQQKSLSLDGESAVSSRNLLPKIQLSPVLDRLFGGSYIELVQKGVVTLDLGGSFQKIQNPNIPIRQQRNGGLEFHQQIQLSVSGKIGEKLKVNTQFDTQHSFDFQNSMKVEYSGLKEDLLKKLEIGNVSLPLNNSLIKGSQNLFGVKAQMQFGKLMATVIATTQRGKQSTVHVNGSGGNGVSQGRPFELVASQYDDNRHFFLAQFFRDHFEKWLGAIPGQITSGINITRVEVYSINRQNDTQTLRDVVAFMDMGETDKIYNKIFTEKAIPDNAADWKKSNDLFDKLPPSAESKGIEDRLPSGLVAGTDFEKINSARKLASTEYTLNAQLGYITLQRKLQNDEALAVAFEYTYNGVVYKVGELTEDYSSKGATEVIYLKMLRPRSIKIRDPLTKQIIPTWNLMMKNIYNLGVTQVTKDGFQLKVIYRDDHTGIDNPQLQDGTPYVKSQQLIKVIGLDRLNPYNDPQPDGNFDFVEGITINSATGLIIIPYLEPFNGPLSTLFYNQADPDKTFDTRSFLNNKYLYDTLYHTTQVEASLITTKNKFYILGTFKAGSGREILIQAFNITPGSVKVFAGGTPLREGIDYSVDYTFGKVTILNEGILSSGKDLDVTYEQQDPFAFQTRSLLGTRLDYKLSDDVNIGGTFLYYNERPLITRNLIGNEPARNIQYGVDLNMKKNSRILTKMVDALPFIQTKETSTVSVNAEFAQLLPGTSNKIHGQGTSFIDDFENAATPYSLISPQGWKLASTPRDQTSTFDPSRGINNKLEAGFKRAKLAWYQVDNIFYTQGSSSYAPPNINLNNHYTRPVLPQEIFPYFDPYIGNFYQPVFNLAYFPAERGQYNYNPDLNPDGSLKNANTNWAGITTAIRTNVDFDAANIEYIEFWLMDPFINGANGVVNDGSSNPKNNTDTNGKLIFHVGSVSEDVGHDGYHAFENGLPADGNVSSGTYTDSEWGYVTNKQYLNNAFDISPSTRANQDVGLDGLSSAKELSTPKFQKLNLALPSFPVETQEKIKKDPSADDFRYYLGDDWNAKSAQILERYKNYNGMENNSPIITGAQAYSASGSTIPDNEDLNGDNTLTDLEEYYAYNIDLSPNRLQVGTNKYIVDKITPVSHPDVTWYLFRIPIRNPDNKVGSIDGFKTIKYIRMILTGFKDPVVLRMANFRSVGQRWRQYAGRLQESQLVQVTDPDLDKFTVSTVNIEENGQPDSFKPGYVEPIARDRDVTSAVQRRLNEQSGQLCVTDLPDGDARAMYKNVSMDFFNYGRIKMFLSAHGPVVKDNQVKAFLRMGTDPDQNYYEIEIPLKITPGYTRIPSEVWPVENEIDLSLDQLYALKILRDRDNASLNAPYPVAGAKLVDGKHSIRIMGRPDMSQVKVLMIGIRNPKSADGRSFDVCMWADELRLTDFDQTAGWAANVVVNTKLADLGTLSASYRHIGFGYGDVQSKISARARSNTNQFDISMNLNLEKLLPRNTGLKIPFFFSYESIIIDPKYDPANPDLRIKAALQALSPNDGATYLKVIQDRSYRRSLNFTNVRKTKLKKDAKSHIYDIENFSFTYSFTEAKQHNFNYLENTRKNVKGAVAWQWQSKFGGFHPLKNTKFVSSKYLQLAKDFNFNPVPSNISVRGELERSYSKLAYRAYTPGNPYASTTAPAFQKFFIFNRYYNFSWQLTKSLKLDYNATVNAIIDEPDSDPNGGYSISNKDRWITKQQFHDSVMHNLKNFGRIKYFDQNIAASYTLPFDKFPLTNWINGDYRQTVGYNWKAGPLQKDPKLQLGNIAQNSKTQTFSGKFDMVKLYNKIGFLKSINTPKPPPPPPPKNAAERLKLAKADTLPHPPELKLIRGVLRLIMSIKSINGTYNVTEGTMLPGFTKSPKLFGLDQDWKSPGVGFVLGSQDAEIRHRAANNGWLSTNKNLTTPFSQNQTRTLSLTANMEPAPEIKMQLNANKTTNSSFQELFKFDSAFNGFRDLSPSRSGSYKISFIAAGTSFNHGEYLFTKFKDNIGILSNRFNTLNNRGYENQSQDVLIPAFIAAYSGKSAHTVGLSPFPKIPLPNWRIDYNGLTKLEAFKDIFTSVSINHAYTSSYTVGNYSNSLQYNTGTPGGFDVSQLSLSNSIESYNSTSFASVTDASSNGDKHVVPIYVINQVLISETFAPLVGVSLKTKSKLNLSFKYNTKRDISLNVPNAQITEMTGKDWQMEIGYTKNNMRLPFRDQGRIITLKNDVTFRMTMGVTSTQTIQRRIDEGSTVTNGNINFQLRPNISYVVNKQLQIQLYFERTTNHPLVTNSYPRFVSKGGVKIIFNLSQ